MTYEEVCALLRRSSRPLLIHWRRAYLRLGSSGAEGAGGGRDDSLGTGGSAAGSAVSAPPKTPAPRATTPTSDAVPTKDLGEVSFIFIVQFEFVRIRLTV